MIGILTSLWWLPVGAVAVRRPAAVPALVIVVAQAVAWPWALLNVAMLTAGGLVARS